MELNIKDIMAKTEQQNESGETFESIKNELANLEDNLQDQLNEMHFEMSQFQGKFDSMNNSSDQVRGIYTELYQQIH